MKIASRVVLLIYVVVLNLTQIQAMENLASTHQTHQLVGIIKTIFFEFDHDHPKIFFVKELSNQHVVAFNSDGFGSLFARQHPLEKYAFFGQNKQIDDMCNYKPIKNLCYARREGDRPCDVFEYQDSNGQNLLIAFDVREQELSVWNLNEEDKYPYGPCRLRVGHYFNLAQKSDKSLVMLNLDDDTAFHIDLTWKEVIKYHKNLSRKNFLFTKTALPDWPPDDEFDEETLIDSETLQTKGLRFPANILDFNPLTYKQKKYLSSFIWSYHRMSNDLVYCGHDNGLVSVWAPIKASWISKMIKFFCCCVQARDDIDFF